MTLGARALFTLVLVAAMAPGVASAQNHRSSRSLTTGRAYLAAGDRGSAIGYFRDALGADPNHAEAYVALAEAYEGRGALQEARRVFQAGLARRADHMPLWEGLTRVLAALGHPEEAARAARELTQRDPHRVAGWLLRARLATARGAWSEALTAYRRVVALAEDEGLVEDASRREAALRLLAAPMDPVSAPRVCTEASPVRRALARCRAAP